MRPRFINFAKIHGFGAIVLTAEQAQQRGLRSTPRDTHSQAGPCWRTLLLGLVLKPVLAQTVLVHHRRVPMTATPSTSAADALPSADVSLTLEELASLTTGADYWSTVAVSSAGLRSVRVADGPHGLRVQDDDNPDHLGLGRSKPATCFPPAVTLASSWDPVLVREVGIALGREARSESVDVVLGPGLNLKRSPLCGRNFEYFSEDPFLAGTLAGAMVDGIESNGVGACLKHFAANNQETDRQRVSAVVDERTLREMYLKAFEIALRDTPAWTIMSAYNRINGDYASENPWLLTKVLREEWGYDGLVISDWGAVHDPVLAVTSGLDLRMPGRPDDGRVLGAARDGSVDTAALHAVAERIRTLADRTTPPAELPAADRDAHSALTRRAAAESAVLLQNNGLLPLTDLTGQRVLIVGELARTPRYQGAGSSAVNPTRVVSTLDALQNRLVALGAEVMFSAGYQLQDDEPDEHLQAEAVALAASSDLLVLCLGLPARFEAEGRDRTSIELPAAQLALLAALAAVERPTAVVLSNGSAVTTAGWRQGVDAILEVWLTGQEHGNSVTDVLLGEVNPSGKLAETIPIRLSDTPSYLNFPGESGQIRYGEGVFIGYRYYDACDTEVDYAFGHGLSYTTFGYSDLSVTVNPIDDETALVANLTVTNTGSVAGAEVVQVYLEELATAVRLAPRALRGYAKHSIQPGEVVQVSIPVARRDLGYYSVPAASWAFEGGQVGVRVGSSSRDLRLAATVDVPGRPVIVPLSTEATLAEWFAHPTGGPALRSLLDERGGFKGRMADLLADEIGAESVLGVPLSTLLEFPGVPLTAGDAERILQLD